VSAWVQQPQMVRL